MWTCPNCIREFKKRNQEHTCGIFRIENVFIKAPNVFPLFELLLKKIAGFGDMKINAVKNGVMFSVNSTFLAVKPRQKYLVIEFATNNAHDTFPVEKCVRISKTRYAHVLKIDTPENINKQLIDWIKEAYLFDSQKKMIDRP